MDNNEVIQMLQAARERLFTKGWTQGRFGPAEGPNCMMGALVYENDGYHYSLKVTNALASVLDDDSIPYINSPIFKVEYFNDQSGRTFDEVIEVFDKAIKKVEMENG